MRSPRWRPALRTGVRRAAHRSWRFAAPAALLLAAVGCSTASGGTGDKLLGAPSDSVSVVAVTATSEAGQRSWSPWPQALHDARHSGASTVTGPQDGTVRWRRNLGGSPLPTGPVVGPKGTIYLVDSVGMLHALDPADGHDLWTADTGQSVSGDLSISPLVLPDGSVVAGARQGLAAWSAWGRKTWSVELGGGLTSPVTSDGKRIYVGSTGGHVAAVDVTSTGKAAVAWDLDTKTGNSHGSVVTDGHGRVLTTSESGLVSIRDRGNRGQVQWTADPKDGTVEVSAGLSAGGVGLLGTNGHHEWAYSTAGKLLWKASREETYSSPSVTADGLAYVGEHNSQVHVFAADSGRQVGRYPSGVTGTSGKTGVWTSVVVDRRHDVYFGTRSHYLIGVRPNGTRLFTVDLGTSTASYPALTGNGRLVIGTDTGDVLMVG